MEAFDASANCAEYRGVSADVRVTELPLEPIDSFSDAPFEFENTARMLWEDTQKVYYHACAANRFSEDYLKLSGQLEKSIRQLGSWCLTKAVLEQKGMEFPDLENLSIRELVCMVSFHLRKAHAALEGIYQDNNALGMTYLDWEFRWVGLGNRLKATEAKIQKIRDGVIDADKMLEKFGDQWSVAGGQESVVGERKVSASRKVQSLRMNPAALPIQGSMAREIIRAEKERSREQDRRFHELVREASASLGVSPRSLMPQPFRPSPPIAPMSIPEEPVRQKPAEKRVQAEEKSSSGKLTEAEARKILIDRAMEAGDMKTVMEIQKEDEPTFHARWDRHIAELKRQDAMRASGQTPPSDAKRKKLREKRKKRK